MLLTASEKHLEQFLDAIPARCLRARAMMLLIILRGLSAHQIVNLRRDGIGWKPLDKNWENYMLEVPMPNGTTRALPILEPCLIEALNRYLAREKRRERASKLPPATWLFHRKGDGTKQYSRRLVMLAWNHWAKKAGVSPIRIRHARNSFAYVLMNDGAQPETVAKITGRPLRVFKRLTKP
jgi:site-specific recombinase XerD